MDDCLSEAIPIVFATKSPYRNIERQFKHSIGEPKSETSQHFLKIWGCMSDESDGTISTKSIEDVHVEVLETELNLNVTFLGQLQDLLDSAITRLSSSTAILSSSIIMANMDLMNKILMDEKTGIDFSQIDMINRVFSQMDA